MTKITSLEELERAAEHVRIAPQKLAPRSDLDVEIDRAFNQMRIASTLESRLLWAERLTKMKKQRMGQQ